MGTEFWTAYMSNTNPPGGIQGSQMFLYITSNVNTTGKIEITDGSFAQTFSVTANNITTISVPVTAYLPDEGIYNKGIHITSANPIAIYAHIFAQQSSGATLLLPVNTMGKDYYSINYTQKSNIAGAESALMVIATEDSTTIQITPPPANTELKPTTVNLSKGQVYELLNTTDLTGARIQSVSSGTSTCKKIAVFTGSTRILIGCSNTSSDNLFQQVYPTASWGKDYITVPLKNRPYDVFRIIMSDPNTVLTVNGATISPAAYAKSMFYEFNSTTPNIINADKPIQVVQYAITQGNGENCQNLPDDRGDPEMIFLTPLEQTLDHVTLYSTSNFEILQSYINVLIPAAGVPSFLLDGNNNVQFSPVGNGTGYFYAQVPVAAGTHTISAGAGFNAIAYGFGTYESYGYAAGANLADLNEFLAFLKPETNVIQYNGCTNEAYDLQLTLPYKTSKITWTFDDNTTPIVQNNPVVASAKVNGDKTLYVYQYPGNPVIYHKRDSYAISATVFNAGADECGSYEQVNFNFNISNLPVVNFDVDNAYVGIETAFKDETVPDTVIKSWDWDFGDGQKTSIQNPRHAYAAPGKYTVTETVTDVDGCSSLIQKTVGVNTIVSPLNGSIVSCQGSASAAPYIENFSVTAAGLTAPLIVGAPSGFELSLSAGTGYTGNITLTPAAGAVNKVNIYVRAAATAPAGTIGGQVSITSAGIAGVKFNVWAIVNALPVVNTVADMQYKNGTVTPVIPLSGNGNTFTWTNDNPIIGLPASGTGDIPSFPATNTTGTTNITANISVTTRTTGMAYITNADSNLVSLIDPATNSVVGGIKIYGSPQGVAVSPNTGKVYVTDSQVGKVSVIDEKTNTVTNTIAVGSNPLGICASPGGGQVYVANSSSNNVSVIDAASGQVTHTISVGNQPMGITVSSDGTKIFVANVLSNTISVISTETNQVTATIKTGLYPFALALSPDGSTLYVTNMYSNSVSVIDIAAGQVTGTIGLSESPNSVCVTPDGSLLYITCPGSGNVLVVGTSTYDALATIPAGTSPYGISLNADGSFAYVANKDSGDVDVIDTKTNKVVSIIKTAGGARAFGNFVLTGSACSGIPMQFHITVFFTPPVKIQATGTLQNLVTTYGTPSSPAGFMLSGEHTVAPVTVIAPVGFEVSTSNVAFMPEVSVGDTGAIAPTAIYVRLKSTTAAGTYPNDIIKIGTKNADTLQTLSVPLGTVNGAPLTIRANDQSRLYGYVNPPLTVSYTGFVNGEDTSVLIKPPVVSTMATIRSDVGKYEITVDSAIATNYLFTYIPGTLTVMPSGLGIPNTFTPNGDGINDTWNIKYIDYFPGCIVDIFNRYGQKLFHSVGYSIPWNGTFNSTPLLPGTYYYIINLQNGSAPISGYVTIIK